MRTAGSTVSIQSAGSSPRRISAGRNHSSRSISPTSSRLSLSFRIFSPPLLKETMGFNCGIVGLPNVGKSTLFNAITAAGAAAENYPFCTIDPNVGVVAVPDSRLDELVRVYRPAQVTPTSIEFVDIAGLGKGASRGEGLGNQF